MELLLTLGNCNDTCPDNDKCNESYSRNCGITLNMSDDMFPIFKKLISGLDGLYHIDYANSNTFIFNEKFIKSFNVDKEIVSALAVDNKEFAEGLQDLKTFFKHARKLKRSISLEFLE